MTDDVAAIILRYKRDLDIAFTALRRIRSLDAKNVPKYAQQIAREALDQMLKGERDG